MDEGKIKSRLKGHVSAIQTGFKYLISSKRMTLKYPYEIMELPRNYRGMIELDVDKCIGCSFCARICPANAIKMYKRNGKRNPGVNYLRCIFCGFCVDICPVNALRSTSIHDAAFATLDENIYTPEKMVKLQKPPFKKKPKIVKVEFDEKRGLVYESASD